MAFSIVIQLDPAVLKVTGKAVPLPEGVSEGLAEGSFGKVPAAGFEAQEGALHPPEDGSGLGLTVAKPGPGAGEFPALVRFAELFLDLIEVLDLAQEPAGPLRANLSSSASRCADDVRPRPLHRFSKLSIQGS
jgi:hypothetical protein